MVKLDKDLIRIIYKDILLKGAKIKVNDKEWIIIHKDGEWVWDGLWHDWFWRSFSEKVK